MGNGASVGLADEDQLDAPVDSIQRAKKSAADVPSSSSVSSSMASSPIRKSDDQKSAVDPGGDDVNALEILFQYIAYYGQGDSANDSIVRGTLAGLPMEEIDSKDAYGNTLLLLACQYGCEDLIRIMLKKGANPNATNGSGACCLHFACYKESASKSVAKVLLQNGAIAEVAETTYGCTPLHYCAGTGDIELCKLLVSHGAQVETRDFYNYTCEDYAREAGYNEVSTYFREKMEAIQDGRGRGLMSPGGGHNSSFSYGSTMSQQQILDTGTDWACHVDPASGARYYVHHTTQETLWESDLKIRLEQQRRMGSPPGFGSPIARPPPSQVGGSPADVLTSMIGGASPSPAPAEPPKRDKAVEAWANSQATRVRLIALLGKYDPTRLLEVDKLLTDSKGKESDMFASLCEEYGAEEAPEFKDLAKKNLKTQEDDLLGGVTTPRNNAPPPKAGVPSPGFMASGLPCLEGIVPGANPIVRETALQYEKDLAAEKAKNKATIDAKTKELDEIQEKVDVISFKHADIDAERVELSSKVEESLEGGGSAISTAEQEVSNLQKSTTALRTEISTFTEELSSITQKFNALESSLVSSSSTAEDRAIAELQAAEERASQEKERNEKHSREMAEADEKGQATVDRVRKELDRVKDERAKALEEADAQLESMRIQKEKEIADCEAEVKQGLGAFQQEIAEAKEAIEKAIDIAGDCTSEAKDAEHELEELQPEVGGARAIMAANAQLHKDLHREQQSRKRLHNELEEMKGKVRIVARIRPFSMTEIEQKCSEAVVKDGKLSVLSYSQAGSKKMYDFDSVYGGEGAAEGNSQKDIFDEVKNLVTCVVDGFNVSVLSYGQTGAGKSYSILGATADVSKLLKDNGDPDKNAGIAPRALHELFKLLADRHSAMHSVVLVSIMQMYKEELKDLLWVPENKEGGEPASATPPTLEICPPVDPNAAGIPACLVQVRGAVEKEVQNVQDVLKLYADCVSRHTQTNFSRCHLVVRVTVLGTNRRSEQVSVGRMVFADLAGSEKIDKGTAGANDVMLKEGMSISRALTAVGDVVVAVSSGHAKCPHKAHPLTELLADCMNTQAKTVVLVALSPNDTHSSDSVASLTFAAKCKDTGGGGATGAVQAQQLGALKKELAKLKQKSKDTKPDKKGGGLARPG